MTVTFTGGDQDKRDLAAAFGRNCTCKRSVSADGVEGEVIKRCASCTAVSTDQRLLNGLSFMRVMRGQLEHEEFDAASSEVTE